MKNIEGKCVCGAVTIVIKEYGSFVYTCHCDACRKLNSGPVFSIDPGSQNNVVFAIGKEQITVYIDEDVQRGFCCHCGTTLYWYDPSEDHYCMNAELFTDIIKKASFKLELFYDMKPDYYSFSGSRKKLDRNFEEIE